MDVPTIGLDQLAEQINAEHRSADELAHSAVGKARRAGELLLEAKQRIGHGNWLGWLKSNCPEIAERSVQAYMKLARLCLEHPEKAADLDSLTLRHALASLSAPRSLPAPKSATVADLTRSDQQPAVSTARPEPIAGDSLPAPEFKIEDYNEAEDGEAIARAEQELAKAFDTIVASDDRFPALNAEIKRLSGLLAAVTGSRDHYQNQAGEAVRQLKAERRKSERLERVCERQANQIEQLREENERLRERIAVMEEPA